MPRRKKAEDDLPSIVKEIVETRTIRVPVSVVHQIVAKYVHDVIGVEVDPEKLQDDIECADYDHDTQLLKAISCQVVTKKTVEG